MSYIFTSYDKASKLTYKDIAKHDTTSNGRVKGVITGKLQVLLTLIHKVGLVDKARFVSYYNTNKDVIVDVTYGGVIYNLNFSSNPVYTPLNGDLWKITTKFTGLA